MRAEVRLLRRAEVAAGTAAFWLARPEGFAFRPGQAVSLELPEPPPGANNARRTFSLASAPHEAELMLATRLREGSEYKRALGALAPGAPLRLRGPLGAMTLHEDAARPALFVAGGIGITPFLSMVREAVYRGLGHRLFLVYSARRAEEAPFLEELQDLAKRHARLRLVARMTEREGLLDDESVRRVVREAGAPLCYLAGPPGMVTSATAMLQAAGVPAAEIHAEEFFGY